MTNIERIVNSEESLEEIKQSLIEAFQEDYGSKHSDVIKEKINNGIYFFETTPDIMFRFMLKNAPSLLNKETIQIEYQDYVTKQYEIGAKLTDELFRLYAVAFNLTRTDIARLIYKKEQLINLPVESYYDNSTKSKNKYLQKEYLKQCEELKIRPIFDSGVIEQLLMARKKCEKNSNTKMITDTIWGKRINEEFTKKVGKKSSPEFLADMIYGHPCNIEVPNNCSKNKKILYFPLMRQYFIGDMDTTFLHEVRHMVECGRLCSGLDWPSGNYKILNELRVEKHAIKDNERTGVIFSKEGICEGVYSPYRIISPLADDFIDEYEPYLDQLAIYQNIARLEETFGYETIKEYGIFLNQAFNDAISSPFIKTYRCSEEEKNKSKEYTKKLKEKAKSSIN